MLLSRRSKKWWRGREAGGGVSCVVFEVNQSCSDWRRRRACFVLGCGIICISRISAAIFEIHPIFSWTLHRRGLKTVISSGMKKQAEAISSLVEDTFLLSMANSFEIIRDDGTSLGKYKAPPRGKPISEVLEVIFNMTGLDGHLVEDLAKSDLLTAGHVYKFQPSINVPHFCDLQDFALKTKMKFEAGGVDDGCKTYALLLLWW